MFSTESDNVTTYLISNYQSLYSTNPGSTDVEEAHKTWEVSMCMHVSV